MRSSWKSRVAVAVGLLALPQLAAADDVQDQLQQMQERMSQLEQKLTATTDQLDESNRRVEDQEKLIERAGLEERSAASGVSSFFENVEFGGWVAASYWYNLNAFDNGANNVIPASSAFAGNPNTGTFGLANPFHPDTQTFQLDQLWFEMSKAATEESRGGFGADIVMGKTADLLPGNTIGFATGAFGVPNTTSNGNAVYVYQAYAEYLAPLGPGVNVKAGRWATHIGAEVAQTTQNFNITRGLVYSVLQPVNHTGLLLSTDMDNGFSFAAGVVNDALFPSNADVDRRKAFVWQAGYGQESWSLTHSGEYGRVGGPGGAGFNAGIFDFLLTWNPSENLQTWADITYVITDDTQTFFGVSPWAVGMAVAGRLAITEATGFAVRGEYIRSEDNFLGVGLNGPSSSSNLWSLTGTIDHALTENLTLKGEARYEEGSQAVVDAFYLEGGPSPITDGQVLIGAEMTYQF